MKVVRIRAGVKGRCSFFRTMKNKLIGSSKFYKHVLFVAIPIMIQTGITNVVGMLDNIMVGQIGTNQMTGVSVVNQLIFVFNLCIFGGVSGAGIFTAQYYGQKDNKGIRDTLRFKLIVGAVVCALAIGLFLLFHEDLIMLFLHEDEVGDVGLTKGFAVSYLFVMLFELFPFAFSQIYASTLRETGETVLPMKAGLVAVFVNLALNYVLIFGKFGMPVMGVKGAALATVISRIVELLIIVIFAHTHTARFAYFSGLFKDFSIPKALVKAIIIKGTPLLLNETLWSAGMAALVQNYSIRGLSVVAALNINSTISNVFNIAFIAMGEAIAIIIGQELGAKKPDVKYDSYRMTFFSVMICIGMGAILFVLAPYFPRIYETEGVVKDMATKFIMISAVFMPVYAYENAAYFTLRSGGKTVITFFFDSVFVWVFSIPLAYLLTHYTTFDPAVCFLLVQFIDFIKVGIGFYLVKKGSWIQDLTKLAP